MFFSLLFFLLFYRYILLFVKGYSGLQLVELEIQKIWQPSPNPMSVRQISVWDDANRMLWHMPWTLPSPICLRSNSWRSISRAERGSLKIMWSSLNDRNYESKFELVTGCLTVCDCFSCTFFSSQTNNIYTIISNISISLIYKNLSVTKWSC